MSHFNVAVFSYHSDDVDMLLEPFYEATENSDYLEFEQADTPIERLRQEFVESAGKYATFDDFLREEYGHIRKFNRDGEEDIGNYRNPNAKWDCWTIGGRWKDKLKLKSGEKCDQAQLKDIDFSRDEVAYAKAIEFWEEYVEEKPFTCGEDEKYADVFWKPIYYREQYADKETYAREVSEFFPWAILTPDGMWYEMGEMGWWGFHGATMKSREEYKEVLAETLKNSDPNLWVTIVDCHI